MYSRSWTISTLVNVLGLVALMLTGMWPLAALMWGFALLYGFGQGAMSPADGVLVADIFQGPHLGLIMGALELGIGVGIFSGSWLGGLIYDATGSYNWAFIIAILIMLSSIAWVWAAGPSRIRRVRSLP